MITVILGKNHASLLSAVCLALTVFGTASCRENSQGNTPQKSESQANPPQQNPSSATKSEPEQTPPAQSPPPVVEKLKADLSPIRDLIAKDQNGPARVRLNDYLKIHPDDGQAVFLFGLSYHREKKYAQAIPYFDRALTLPPLYMPINYFRGWALYYLGEPQQSRAAFESFLQIKPDEPDAHFALGLIAQEEGDLDDAQSKFQRAIELWSRSSARPDLQSLSKAHTRLAEVYDQRGDLEQAKTNLMMAVKLYPDQYEALYKLYRVLVRLGETEHAEAVHAQYLATKERVRPGTGFPE